MNGHGIEAALEQFELPLSCDPLELIDPHKSNKASPFTAHCDIDPRHFYSVPEIGERWAVCENTVRYHIRTGALRAAKHKGRWLALGIDVELFEVRQEKRKASRFNGRPNGSRVVYDIVNQTLREAKSSGEECND